MGQAAQPATAGNHVHYERRRPEETILYQLVQEHVETFFAQVETETGSGLPDFVKDEFDAYLECGVNGGNFDQDESVMAVRAGHGLLTGPLRCARCGRKLHIRYWGKSGTAARYLCEGDFPTGGHYCLGFGGGTVDKRVSEEILNALLPLGVEASVAAIGKLNATDSDRRHALTRQLQQLEFEAQRAFDQYNQVDPTNRLVGEVLEQRWNETLEAVDKVKIELGADDAKPQPLSRAKQEAILALGENFASVWNDSACPMVLKKKIARTVINEIIVDLNDETQQLRFIIHWHGGCHTPIEMPKQRG